MLESIAILIIMAIIYAIGKHGNKLVDGYNKLIGFALVLILIATPFMVLIGTIVDGFSLDTLINGETTGAFTAILIFEIFVAIRLLIAKMFPKENPEGYIPFWQRQSEGYLAIYLLAISIGFFACLLAFDSKF